MSKNYASLVEELESPKIQVLFSMVPFLKKIPAEREKRENLGISAAGEIDPNMEIFKFEQQVVLAKMDALTIENLSLDLLSNFCNFMARLNREGSYHGDIRRNTCVVILGKKSF